MPEATPDTTSIIAPLQVPTTVYNGQVTIAAPRVPLSATSVTIKSVTVTNLAANAIAYIGNATVTVGNGDYIEPGASKSMDIDDLAKVYVIGTVGNVVSYIAVA